MTFRILVQGIGDHPAVSEAFSTEKHDGCLCNASEIEQHQSVVVDGDFEAAGKIVLEADEKNIFRSYVENARYLPTWQKLFASNDGKKNLELEE